MLATIAAMMRRVSVSDDDLAMAAAGCRALAFRYREDAKKQKPVVVEVAGARWIERGLSEYARWDWREYYPGCSVVT